MKRGLVILGVLAMAALGLWSSQSIINAARMLADDDPDVPRTWRNVMSKEDYMLKRAEHIALLRGIGTGLPFDPALRMQAIEQLEEQQRRLLGAAGAGGVAGGAAADAGEGNVSASAFPGNWTLIGPFPIPNGQTVGVSTPVSGRTITIAVPPTNPDIAYVGTAQGGLYRTTNGGASWTALMDDAQSLAVGTVVIAPSNPEILFVGTGEQSFSADSFFGVGVYRIENANRIIASVVGTAAVTVYAASALGTGSVFRSTDGGQTWVQTVDNNFCNPQCFYDIAIDVDPGNPSRVYLGGSPALPFGISTNSGTSFTSSSNGLHVDSHAIAVAPSNPQVIYFGSDGGIYRSNNGGTSWTSLSNTTYSATQFMSVAVHPSDPNFTIGGTQDNGTNMIRSDGTWRRTDYGDGGYAAIDQSSPATGVTIYHTYFNSNAPGGSVMGYAFSENVNAFENWTFRGCQITGAGNDITCTDSVLFYAPLETGPGSPNTVYYGADRLYRSDDKGLTHVVVSQAPIEVNTAATPPGGIPISAIGISPNNDNIRIVGLRNGGIWGTSDGSPVLNNLDPANVVPNTFVARAAIDPNNPNTAYVTLSAFGITNVWKTTSLTEPNWAPASGSGVNTLPQVPVNAFLIDPANSNRLLAGTDIGVYSRRL